MLSTSSPLFYSIRNFFGKLRELKVVKLSELDVFLVSFYAVLYLRTRLRIFGQKRESARNRKRCCAVLDI